MADDAMNDMKVATQTRVDRAMIRYPRLGALHRAIQECQDMSKEASEPQCMALTGVPGAGKTTLVKWYTAAFPRTRKGGDLHIPVLYVLTPSPATVKSVAARILRELGDPAYARGTLWSMTGRVIDHIKECENDLVILDDFHHLIDRETNEVLMAVSEWLKVVIKETGVPFLTVSIEGAIDEIFRANDQLSRLFPVRETLHPFRWDTADADAIKEFSQFVMCAERAVEMVLDASCDRVDLLYRLHYGTRGVVANIMALLRRATIYARKEQHETIELSDLEVVFTKHLAKHVRRTYNPFVPTDETFVEPPPPPDPEPTPPSGKPRRRRTSLTNKDDRG